MYIKEWVYGKKKKNELINYSLNFKGLEKKKWPSKGLDNLLVNFIKNTIW